MFSHSFIAALFTLTLAGVAQAQPAQAPGAAGEQPQGPALKLQDGPVEGALGDVATLKVPEGYRFADKSQMPLVNKLTGNLHNPRDVGALIAKEGWLVFFSFNDVGYVKDDDRDDLDADKLLDTFKEAEGPANQERQRMGFEPMYVVGWETPPFYDPKTNNLTWALKNRVGTADTFNVNHEVRLLGRHGAMSVTLVASPEELAGAVEVLGGLLEGFRFNPGKSYAEYVQGDKVAAYGLSGLVLGGGALAAAKTGLLGKLGKFIKFIVIGVAAAVGGAFKWFGRRMKGEV